VADRNTTPVRPVQRRPVQWVSQGSSSRGIAVLGARCCPCDGAEIPSQIFLLVMFLLSMTNGVMYVVLYLLVQKPYKFKSLYGN
jgi:hypothetical protein